MTYIIELCNYCRRKTNQEVALDEIGDVKIKLKADDVVVHTEN